MAKIFCNLKSKQTNPIEVTGNTGRKLRINEGQRTLQKKRKERGTVLKDLRRF